ncbi:hypothetical protein BASA61_004396 [Batrachochytrium salamandrivorans]|nr:hypothetical protein BASA61_004396 [Batrachochytrium salamandrivorans]
MAAIIPHLEKRALFFSDTSIVDRNDPIVRSDSSSSIESAASSIEMGPPLKEKLAFSKSVTDYMDSTVTLLAASTHPTPRPSTCTTRCEPLKIQNKSDLVAPNDHYKSKQVSFSHDLFSSLPPRVTHPFRKHLDQQHPLDLAPQKIEAFQPVYDVPSAAQMTRPLSQTINLGAVEKLASLLLQLQLDEADALLGRLPCLSRATSSEQHRSALSVIYCGLLQGILALHKAARQQYQHTPQTSFPEDMEHLGAVAHDLFEYITSHDLMIESKLVYAVADHLRFSHYFNKSISRVLNHLPKEDWTDACYSWSLTSHLLARPSKVIASETRIASSIQKFLSKSYVSPNKIEQEVSSLVSILRQGVVFSSDEGAVLSGIQRAKCLRWTRLRLKYEEVWRWYVRVLDVPDWNDDMALDAELSQVKVNALGLFNDVLVVARSYGEFDYAWYMFETAAMTDLHVFINAMGVCLDAFSESTDTDVRNIWEARAWVIYRKSEDRHRGIAYHTNEAFLLQIVALVIEMKDIPTRLRHLERIYRDIELQCNSDAFPITQDLLKILIDQCWETIDLHASSPEWRNLFHKVFDIYSLAKCLSGKEVGSEEPPFIHQTGRLSSASIQEAAHPKTLLSDATFVTLLQICTVSGHLCEFKLLNRDLHERACANEESMANVKRGFAAYLGYYVIASEERANESVKSSNDYVYTHRACSMDGINDLGDRLYQQDAKTAASYGFTLAQYDPSKLLGAVEAVIIKELCH